jgi:hypothetical protein
MNAIIWEYSVTRDIYRNCRNIQNRVVVTLESMMVGGQGLPSRRRCVNRCHMSRQGHPVCDRCGNARQVTATVSVGSATGGF